jgi:hypothetical protein
MDVGQAATFMVGTVLVSIGTVVIVAVAVLVNNILHRYWKPVRLFTADSWAAFNPPHVQYIEQGEVDKSKK